uniref:Uncharacterized protein n=1 Tax=Haptolina ericina TaxID=156174 RepID=A0A7S3BE94_9EUKA|mmetsp:Transcript_57696/g.128737  ORF Transcript_57696/g.128737 Transcript_57696/m.128737 type:complete len:109 (+) Transcript_57696:128-454(+)
MPSSSEAAPADPAAGNAAARLRKRLASPSLDNFFADGSKHRKVAQQRGVSNDEPQEPSHGRGRAQREEQQAPSRRHSASRPTEEQRAPSAPSGRRSASRPREEQQVSK